MARPAHALHLLLALALASIAITHLGCGDGEVATEPPTPAAPAVPGPEVDNTGPTSITGGDAREFSGQILITQPPHGSFVGASTTSVTLAGTVSGPSAAGTGAVVSVRGQVVPVDANGKWSTTVPLTPAHTVQSLVATVTSPTGVIRTDRVAIIRGPSLRKGERTIGGGNIHITNKGLDHIEPIATDLLPINIADAVPVGQTVVDDDCAINILFCVSASAKIRAPAKVHDPLEIALKAENGFVRTDVVTRNMDVPIRLTALGFIPCDMDVHIDRLDVVARFNLSPLNSKTDVVDVRQVPPVETAVTGFAYDFVNFNACSVFEPLVRLIMGGTIQRLTTEGLQTYMNTPGPNGDEPIAGLMQSALRTIHVAESIGPEINAVVDARFDAIDEQSSGVIMRASTDFRPDCIPRPGSPVLDRVFAPPSQRNPTLPTRTPTLSRMQDSSITTSPAGFNQLIRTMVECGMMVERIDRLALEDGGASLPMTTQLLSIIMGGNVTKTFGRERVYIQLTPTMAPFTDGARGNAGELVKLQIPHLKMQMIVDNGDPPEQALLLEMALDVNAGVNLEPLGLAVGFDITPPQAADLSVFVTRNPHNVNTRLLVSVLPLMMRVLFPLVAARIPPFPVPEIAGLQIRPFEVSRVGDEIGIFGDFD